ncbi:MAG: deaminase [Methanotrichaceae archaeon]
MADIMLENDVENPFLETTKLMNNNTSILDNIYHKKFMCIALEEAKKAEKIGDIPIGCVVVKENSLLSRGHNQRISKKNPIMHAELNCIQQAVKKIMNLKGATLYTTHMPCYLCAGAIIQFGISRVISGNSKTLPHSKDFLENSGVEVIDLNIDECRYVLENFIKDNKGIWRNVSQKNLPISLNESLKINPLVDINIYQYPPPESIKDPHDQNMRNLLDLNKELPGKPITLFISIPFCRSQCLSCSFFKNLLPSAEDKDKCLDGYLRLLERQIENYSSSRKFSKAVCKAIYIGGGTASLLSAKQVISLMAMLRTHFNFDPDIEITLECNPLDLNKIYLEKIKFSGINRISIGLQSFNDYILKSLNAPHNGQIMERCVLDSQKIGFGTVNIDMLYGVPNQTFKIWQEDLEKVLNFGPESITIYKYKINKNSNSERLIREGQLKAPLPDEELFKWYLYSNNQMIENNYHEKRHGNYSKPGHDQKYSLYSYDLSYECIGFGAGAYSFINGYVFKSSNSPAQFENNILRDVYQISDYRSNKATKRNLMERYIMHALFSNELKRHEFQMIFETDPLKTFKSTFKKLIDQGDIVIDDISIKPTDLGRSHFQTVLYEFYSKKFRKDHNHEGM